MRKKVVGIIILAVCFYGMRFGECQEDEIIGFYLETERNNPDAILMTTSDYKTSLFFEKTPRLTVGDIVSVHVESHTVSETARKQGEKLSKQAKELGMSIGVPLAYDYLLIKFSPEGKEKMSAITSENINKHLGITIDGELIMAPQIAETISEGEVQVTGVLIKKEKLETIANRINNFIRAREKNVSEN